MQIHQATTDEEYQKIDNFFITLWKEEFNIECKRSVEKYPSFTIYYFQKKGEIISAIITGKFDGKEFIGRFGTLAEHRGKGLGTKLIKHVLEKYEGDVFLDADENQVDFYEHIGFEKTGINREVGNTLAYGMIYRK